MSSNLAEWWLDHPDHETDMVAQGIRLASARVRPDGDLEQRAMNAEPVPDDCAEWLRALFPASVRYPFADRHVSFWEWAWEIRLGIRPRPFVAIWPRGGAKSTSAELATAAVGSRGTRRYALYVRSTQDDADKSVSNIAALFESDAMERHYPTHAERLLSKFGSSKGWRRNRLRTAGGFTVDAIGLDVAVRGVKVEDYRPDFIILDDIDGKHDSKEATQKKIDIITTSILPAGTADCAVLAIQNLIIPNGVFSQLADGRADFLADRIVSGPFPALLDMKTESRFIEELGRKLTVIVSGTPTWEGQDVAACQQLMNTIGPRAFDKEAQHKVKYREGALWKPDSFERIDTVPKLKRVVVAVDPSGGGDEIGIGAVGLGYDGRAYVLVDATQLGEKGPLNWGNKTVDTYDELKADVIVAEKNFGGDMVESNIRVAGGKRFLPVRMVNASRGKAIRAEPVAALYEDGMVVHVGTFEELETELTTWVPGDPTSPNRMDWLVWALTELMLEEQGVMPRVRVV